MQLSCPKYDNICIGVFLSACSADATVQFVSLSFCVKLSVNRYYSLQLKE